MATVLFGLGVGRVSHLLFPLFRVASIVVSPGRQISHQASGLERSGGCFLRKRAIILDCIKCFPLTLVVAVIEPSCRLICIFWLQVTKPSFKP